MATYYTIEMDKKKLQKGQKGQKGEKMERDTGVREDEKDHQTIELLQNYISEKEQMIALLESELISLRLQALEYRLAIKLGTT